MNSHSLTSFKIWPPIISFLIILCFCTCNKKTPSPTAPLQSTPSTPKALLWKISGGALPFPSYLFGTIHLICPADLFNDSILAACLDTAHQLILEINLLDQSQIQNANNRLALPAPYSLKGYYTTDQYDTLINFFQDSFGISLVQHNNLNPIVFNSVISNSMLSCAGKSSYDQLILDLYLHHSTDSLVVGLETPDQQLNYMWSDSFALQARDLYHSVGIYDSLKILFDTLLNIYRNQDIEQLRLISESTDSLYSSERLLNTRNLAWMDTIPSLILSKPSFIAVGAGHLGGIFGLVNLLKQQGFTMTPITLTIPLEKQYYSRKAEGLLSFPIRYPIHLINHAR